MCGIVGFQGRFPAELLGAMTNAVAHRGPDGEGMLLLEAPDQPPTGLGIGVLPSSICRPPDTSP